MKENNHKIIQRLSLEVYDLLGFNPKPLNEEIAKNYFYINNDRSYLLAALIQNPYGTTKDVKKISKRINKKIGFILNTLNLYQRKDQNVLEKSKKHKPIMNLYLTNFKIISDTDLKALESKFKRNKLKYTLQVLEKSDLSILRDVLEDRLFSTIYPKKYEFYFKKRKKHQKNYNINDYKIRKEIKKMIQSMGIKSKIDSRLKTINSIHRKISKKQILFSQVQDIIGLRIIVENINDCYQVMEEILSRWPAVNEKIKDFIAIPKDNGYQSIHITIIYKGHPVEVQIRTERMHHFAEYGKASHLLYKSLMLN